MTSQELALWLVDCRTDRAGRAVELARHLGAARLELPEAAWETRIQDLAREGKVEPLASTPHGVRSLTTGESIALPRAPEAHPWQPDTLRSACTSEFLAAVPDAPWVAGPSRLAPAATVETHHQALRMQLVGGWLGGARGIRLGPWPDWSELDPFGEEESPVVEELRRFQSAVRTLTAGAFQDEPVLLLEPDDPDDEDLRRIYEAWLLFKLAGVHARRVPASAAPRKVLNRARLIAVPGCWRLPQERWVNLGGWVRGGGTLYLGFDDRALARGYEPGWGPPGPGFLEKLVGRRPCGTPPYSPPASENLRLRFQKHSQGFSELREIFLHDLPELPGWPLEALPSARARKGSKPAAGLEVIALGEGQEPVIWKTPLLKGTVVATSLPLEAILACQPDGFSGESRGTRVTAPMGPALSRFFFSLSRLAGVATGKAPLEPFTDLAVARSRGGFPHGVVVVNRRAKRTPGRVPLGVAEGFEANDLLQGRPVAFMKGNLVCPVDSWDYRVVGLKRR